MSTLTSIDADAPRVVRLRDAWIPLAALCAAFFVEMVDNTVLTVALPTLGRDLHAGTTALQWVTSAYSLTFGALLLPAGSLADRLGRRRVLAGGLLAFALLSALVWFVHTPGQLIALRAALGVAAACMAPVTNALVFRLFDDDASRMRAMTLMIVIGMSAMALGPVCAGTALAAVNWHWLLFVNTPVAAVAALGVLRGVPRDRSDELHHAAIDIPAALLIMTAMALGCYSLTSGVERGWASPVTLGCAVGAIVALTALVVRELRTPEPMLDLTLVASRGVRGALLAQVGSGAAMTAAMFLLILHLQDARGWSPLRAGLGNMPFIVMMLAGGPISEALIKRCGHRTTCLIAAALLTGSLLGMAASVPLSYWVSALAMAGLSLGLRIIMTVSAVALVSAVPENQTSLGTALNDVAGELGTSVGAAVAGSTLALVAGSLLPIGPWSSAFLHTFYRGEQLAYVAVAVLVALVSGYGCSTFTDSRATEEH